MKITWYGHSCFRVESADGSFVFDPYEDDYVPGLSPVRLSADAVFCSHGHRDHNAEANVTLTGRKPALQLQTIASFHDPCLGRLRGRNVIHVVTTEGMRVAHLGDLGHTLSGPRLRDLCGVDVLMIPVGGYYTIDSPTAVKVIAAIGPRVVLPMHYRLGGMGYEVLSDLSAFTDLCTNVRVYDTNTIEITKDTAPQTAVLRYMA